MLSRSNVLQRPQSRVGKSIRFNRQCRSEPTIATVELRRRRGRNPFVWTTRVARSAGHRQIRNRAKLLPNEATLRSKQSRENAKDSLALSRMIAAVLGSKLTQFEIQSDRDEIIFREAGEFPDQKGDHLTEVVSELVTNGDRTLFAISEQKCK